MNLSFSQICANNKIIANPHYFTGNDGYTILVMRLTGLAHEGGARYPSLKPPVLIQHGMFDSMDCYIDNYAEVAPAFALVRAGYDVWLVNSRGNKYSWSRSS